MTCCLDFTNANVSDFTNADIINILILTVNFLIFIVYAIMAKYMYKTFTGGQKQTEISLAINQFNIYHFELQGLIEEAKNIKFYSDLDLINGKLKSLSPAYDKANGINYIEVFSMLTNPSYDLKNNQDMINDFRHNVLFPLVRYYDKLFYYLNRVKNDKVLNHDYRNILYNHIESDLLQVYFRICNHCHGTYMTVDLSIFKTEVFDPESFYMINRFFIENKTFQYKDLNFYQSIY